MSEDERSCLDGVDTGKNREVDMRSVSVEAQSRRRAFNS